MLFTKITPQNTGALRNLNRQKATVLVYHPQCIHCVMMRPSWEEMKNRLRRSNKPCNIYEINAEDLDQVHHPIKDSIRGFPTIMNVTNGKFKSYFEKERSPENLSQYVLSHSNSPRVRNTKKVRFVLKRPLHNTFSIMKNKTEQLNKKAKKNRTNKKTTKKSSSSSNKKKNFQNKKKGKKTGNNTRKQK